MVQGRRLVPISASSDASLSHTTPLSPSISPYTQTSASSVRLLLAARTLRLTYCRHLSSSTFTPPSQTNSSTLHPTSRGEYTIVHDIAHPSFVQSCLRLHHLCLVSIPAVHKSPCSLLHPALGGAHSPGSKLPDTVRAQDNFNGKNPTGHLPQLPTRAQL
jgi:hypothetical protein